MSHALKHYLLSNVTLYGLYKRALRNPRLYRLYLRLRGHGTSIVIDFVPRSKSRYGYGAPPHRRLLEIIEASRPRFEQHLQKTLGLSEQLLRIPRDETPGAPEQPYWMNGWLPAFDAAALYTMLVTYNPAHYVEIGSGHSTRFARRAIRDHGLRTRIISIDPHPRAEIDAVCDQVIRQRLEDAPLDVFAGLEPDDMVFVDGSHRVFMNSDVTAFFLDVLPALAPGVLVHMHEVFLPYDYPPDWTHYYYSEQYMLAAHLLARREPAEIVYPVAYIDKDDALKTVLDSLWSAPSMNGVETYGYSFWWRTA